jgi:hypothetical protein
VNAVQVIILTITFVVAVSLSYDAGRNKGRQEGYNQGKFEAKGYELDEEDGVWRKPK